MHLHRILVQHMPEFKNQAKDVVWHIPNQYTQQMAQTSAVVSFNFFVKVIVLAFIILFATQTMLWLLPCSLQLQSVRYQLLHTRLVPSPFIKIRFSHEQPVYKSDYLMTYESEKHYRHNFYYHYCICLYVDSIGCCASKREQTGWDE